MFGLYGDAGSERLERRDRQRYALEFNGVKHANYIELAKKLIATEWVGHFFDTNVRDVFAYKGAKNGLLKALRTHADQFPALQGDITKTTLYYILSCRQDGFGAKDDTRSLRELRAIQRANAPDRSLTACYEATIGSQDEWDQYEFILRYEKLADPDLQEAHKEQYHDAIIAFMKKTSSGTQKLRLFFKLDSETDKANYEKGCAMIKERFQPPPRHFNDDQFASWVDLLKKRKNLDACIRFVAAADRRELLEKHILNDQAVVAFLKDNRDHYLSFFSAAKLRPKILEAFNGTMPPKKTWIFPWTSSSPAPVPAPQSEGRELQEVVRSKNKK